MYTNTPSDRMQLRGVGELRHPAQCMVCGSATREEGYVDLGVWYEFEGNMLLCALCVIQAAEIIGCLTPDEAEHLKEQATELAARLELSTTELEAANERLAHYDAILGRLNPGNVNSSASAVAGIITSGESERDIDTNSLEGSESGKSDASEFIEARSGESTSNSEFNVLDGKSPKSKRTATFDL